MTSGVCLFACVDAEQRSGLVTVNETDQSQLFYWYFPPENGERPTGGQEGCTSLEMVRGEGWVRFMWHSRGYDVWAGMSIGCGIGHQNEDGSWGRQGIDIVFCLRGCGGFEQPVGSPALTADCFIVSAQATPMPRSSSGCRAGLARRGSSDCSMRSGPTASYRPSR